MILICYHIHTQFILKNILEAFDFQEVFEIYQKFFKVNQGIFDMPGILFDFWKGRKYEIKIYCCYVRYTENEYSKVYNTYTTRIIIKYTGGILFIF